MAFAAGKPPDKVFAAALRQALAALYDPGVLHTSPLLELTGATKSHDPLGALRVQLIAAVRTIKPGAGVPQHAEAWRLYRALAYRYVEQMGQKEVAADLALSIRQLRRYEAKAIRLLADRLWAQYGQDHEAEPGKGALAGVLHKPGEEQELAWLRTSLPDEVADVVEATRSALHTAIPLLRAAGVTVEDDLPAGLPLVAGQASLIRQALLNVFSAAAYDAGANVLRLAASTNPTTVTLLLVLAPPWHRSTSLTENLDSARRLLGLVGGALQATGDDQEITCIELALPAAQKSLVLVIDDNADALQLMERYLAGTRYLFHGLRDPEEAVRVAATMVPSVIILDVMLSGIDGWELLGRLRAHPALGDVPVIVATFLPQEQLALSLGAAGFLRKPVTQEAVLSALEHQRAERGSRQAL